MISLSEDFENTIPGKIRESLMLFMYLNIKSLPFGSWWKKYVSQYKVTAIWELVEKMHQEPINNGNDVVISEFWD